MAPGFETMAGTSAMTAADDGHPTIKKDVPIGVPAKGTRREFDSMGDVEVPADRYWGAQTQRSLQHFSIGTDRMPKEVYHAYGIVKKACALVNEAAGRLPGWKAAAIVRAADEAIAGELGSQHPIGPNDDVNMSQSSNDSFPAAMHIAAMTLLDERLIPELDRLAA